jgi:peroxiredoxin family protein
MSADTPVVAPGLQGLVAAEVARHVAVLREEVEAKIAEVRERTVDDAATIVVFSADLDKVLTAFVLATGTAAAGLRTSMFFTFWGLSVLRKKGAEGGPKSLVERMLTTMSPSGPQALGTSRLNLFGLGAAMLRKAMRDKRIASLEELIATAGELDVKMIACTMSMDAMGLSPQELVDGLTFGGVATYMADAVRSRVTLFI